MKKYFTKRIFGGLLSVFFIAGNCYANFDKQNTNSTAACPTFDIYSQTIKYTPTCNDSKDGAIELNVTGGTAPYTYLWSDGQTKSTANNLPVGDINVKVTDANGCSQMGYFRFSNPYTLNYVVKNNTCGNGMAGQIDLPEAYSCMCSYSHCVSDFKTPNGTPVGTIKNATVGAANPGAPLNNLKSGTYNYTFTSTYGCVMKGSLHISPDSMQIAIVATPESHTGAHDATAKANVSGGNGGAYTYKWNDPANQTTQTATGLITGNTYTVTVTDNANCSSTKTVKIGVSATTGISTSIGGTTGIDVFPNPSSELITINIDQSIISSYSLTLYDLSGRTVREYEKNQGSKLLLEKQELKPGVYQAILRHPNGSYSFRIIFTE